MLTSAQILGWLPGLFISLPSESARIIGVQKTDYIFNAVYTSINLRRNPLSPADPIPALINGIKRVGLQALEQAAQGCGGISIPGRVHKTCRCGAYEHGLVVHLVMLS